MTEPVISVVIPAYRAARTIERAVDSVLGQTRRADEIIVVDDGSPDDLAEVLGRYGSRVRLLRKRNGGAASARNLAIEECRGELIAFLDADDYWEPKKLERQLEVFRRHPEVGLVACRFYCEEPGKERLPPDVELPHLLDKVLKLDGDEAFAMATQVWTTSVIVRREVLGEHRFCSGLEPAEDRDLWVRLISAAPVYCLSQPQATLVLQPGSLSRSNVERDCYNMLRVVRRNRELLGARGLRRWEAYAFRRWASGYLGQHCPRAACKPAWERFIRQPLSLEAIWILLKSAFLALCSMPLKWEEVGFIEDRPLLERNLAQSRRVARNVVLNVIGIIVPALIGLLVAPFLIRRLGETTYGLWILIGSVGGYFGLLDFGVRGSVGRHVALYHAKRDQSRINAVLNTGLVYLSAVGALMLLATTVIPWVFFALIHVPPADATDVRLAVILIGINVALELPLAVFDATLWGCQRFDLLNSIDIPLTVARAAGTVLLIANGYGLASLAAITLASTLFGAALKALLSFRLIPGLRIGTGLATREMGRELFSYGIWAFILSLSVIIPAQTFPFVIGICLSLPLVTSYAVAARLVSYANQTLRAATDVLAPVAATLHASEDTSRQQRLLLKGWKYCFGLAIFFTLAFVCLGRSFIDLWIGPSVASASWVLVILALGEFLPMSQGFIGDMSLGMGRHRVLAIVGILEVTASIVLGLLFASPWGLAGVCIGFTLPGAICRGMFRWWYGGHLVSVGFREYMRGVILPVIGAALVPGIALVLVVNSLPLESWPALALCALGFIALYTISFFLIAAREEIHRFQVSKIHAA